MNRYRNAHKTCTTDAQTKCSMFRHHIMGGAGHFAASVVFPSLVIAENPPCPEGMMWYSKCDAPSYINGCVLHCDGSVLCRKVHVNYEEIERTGCGFSPRCDCKPGYLPDSTFNQCIEASICQQWTNPLLKPPVHLPTHPHSHMPAHSLCRGALFP